MAECTDYTNSVWQAYSQSALHFDDGLLEAFHLDFKDLWSLRRLDDTRLLEEKNLAVIDHSVHYTEADIFMYSHVRAQGNPMSSKK